MKKKLLSIIISAAIMLSMLPGVECRALVNAGFETTFHLGNHVNYVGVDGIVIDNETGETNSGIYTNGHAPEYLTAGTEIKISASLDSGYQVGAVLSNRNDIDFKITNGKTITFTVPDATGWGEKLEITILSDKPEPPTDLVWDGTTAKWKNPNGPDIVSETHIYVYNTKNLDDVSDIVMIELEATEYDFADSMVPGDTYYFEVGFIGTTGKSSEEGRSANYTVPGSYTLPQISDVKLDYDGKLTWSKAPYETHYEAELFVKNGDSWNLVASEQWIAWGKTSYTWACKFEYGKTYKATLIAKQGMVPVSQKTECLIEVPSEIQNVHISPDGMMTWDPFPGASSYYCQAVTAWTGTTTSCSCDLKKGLASGAKPNGVYTVQLYARDSERNKISETWEGTYTYENTEPKLEDPTNIKWDGTVVSWDPVTDAVKYHVFVYVNGDSSLYTVEDTCFDIAHIVSCEDECYVDIMAYGTYNPASDWARSETITIPHHFVAASSESHECSVCRVQKPHSSSEKVVTKATVTKNGKIDTKCKDCGGIISTKTIYYPKTVKLSTTAYTYDGNAKTPKVTVTDSNGNIIKTYNYTVEYPFGRANVGTYQIKITFKGNYSGTKTVSFKVNPPKTAISSLTAGSKRIAVKWSKKTKQVTGYQIQYSTSSTFKSSKTATVTSYKTVSKTLTKLQAKKRYYVRIRTYKIVNGKKYYSAWSAKKYVTTKA